VRFVTKRSATARSYPVRIQRLPVGPLAPMVMDECSRWFAAKGYSPGSAAGAVNLAQRLSDWMDEVGVGVGEIDEGLLARFIAAERSRERPCSSVKRWMGALRRFLAAAGYLRMAGINEEQLTPAQAAVTEWCAWMRVQRGLTAKSVSRYCYYAAGLLDAVTTPDGSVQWDRLNASVVNVDVADRGRP
jgi:hypothetical protein